MSNTLNGALRELVASWRGRAILQDEDGDHYESDGSRTRLTLCAAELEAALAAQPEAVASDWPDSRVNIPDPHDDEARIVGFRVRPGDPWYGTHGLSEPLFALNKAIAASPTPPPVAVDERGVAEFVSAHWEEYADGTPTPPPVAQDGVRDADAAISRVAGATPCPPCKRAEGGTLCSWCGGDIAADQSANGREVVTDVMVKAALDGRVPGGAEVRDWFPSYADGRPHKTATAVMRAALTAALEARDDN